MNEHHSDGSDQHMEMFGEERELLNSSCFCPETACVCLRARQGTSVADSPILAKMW